MGLRYSIMSAFTLALAAVVALPAPTTAQAADTVRYDVSFPDAPHHEAAITVTYTNLPRMPLELRMSRTSPGRYALHEFGKNVYNVRAVDGAGRALDISRPNPHQWDVAGHDGTVRVSYTLFADRADGTYTGIDLTHAHMNMPATFMWARNTGDRPIGITFNMPPGSNWKVATQLRPTANASYYVAPHLQYFLDSPTQLSDFELREWTVASGGRTQTIRIAIHHLGTDAELDRYTAHTKRIVEEQQAVFGELPEFDFGSYTFIADYLPWVAGDGMEHRNSTILTNTGSLANDMVRVLGTVSHEFFHAWNVERLRPATLEPFDFEEANMSDALWFAEGFTSYYGPLTMRRGGVTDDVAYAATLGGMLNTVINSPGRRYFSPIEMSMQAPFVDAATAVDPNNRANTFISYYTWGAMIGLALDLSIRQRFDGITLDDYMRALWRSYGMHQQNFTPTRPYTIDELQATLAEVTGDAAFATDFFRRRIRSGDVADYRTLLAQAGIMLRPARADRPFAGAPQLAPTDGGVLVTGSVLVGTPLYEAGVDRGDVIISIDGAPIASAAALNDAISAKRVGDTVELSFMQRGSRRTATATLIEDPALEVVLYEDAGMQLTDAMRAFRTSWLGAKAR